MELHMCIGREPDHIMGDQTAYNYGLSLIYTPFQFSTYNAQNPCFFGGGITLGFSGAVQPERGYCEYSHYPDNTAMVIRPNGGGIDMHNVQLVIEREYVEQLAWRAHFSLSVPLMFTVRIGNTDTHHLSVGLEPGIRVGMCAPSDPQYRALEFLLRYQLSSIMQYKYRKLFVSLRPTIEFEYFNWFVQHPLNSQVCLGIGWNF